MGEGRAEAETVEVATAGGVMEAEEAEVGGMAVAETVGVVRAKRMVSRYGYLQCSASLEDRREGAPASHSCLAVAAHCLPPLWRSQMQKARVLLARSGSAARTAPMCSTGNRLQIARPTAGRARADPSSSRTGCR